MATLLAWPFALSLLAGQSPGPPATANWEGHATWSPDGRRVAYESDRTGNVDIVVRDAETGAETPYIAHPADDTEPSWSPSGDCLAFRSERDGGGLFVQCGTGEARRLATGGHDPQWTRDGGRLLYATHGDGTPGLHVVSKDGGASTTILGALTSTLVGTLRAVWAPDARIAVVGTHPEFGAGFWLLREDAAAAPPPAARLSRLLTRIMSRNPPRFQLSAEGTAIYLTGRPDGKPTLFRVPIDRETGAIRGGPEPVADWTGDRVDVSLSPSGTRLAVAVHKDITRILVAPFDHAAPRFVLDKAQRVGPEDGRSVFPDFSPDGRLLLYTVLRDGKPSELRAWSAVTGVDALLSADGGYRFGPRWSPGGTSFAYRWHGSSGGVALTALRMIDLAAKRETAVTSPSTGTPYTAFGWSPDGQHILASALREDDPDVALVSLPLSDAPKAERKERILAAPKGFKLWQARTSPNGRWIVVNMSPVNDAWSSIAVVPAGGGDARRLTTDDDAWDDKPRWSSDGRAVFFLSRRSGSFELWRIGVDPDTGAAAGAATRVSSLTSPRRRVLPDLGVLDLGLSASRLAVPVQETRSALRIVDAPAGTVPTPLTLCTSREPQADAAMPVETEGVTLPLLQVSASPRFPERALMQGVSGTVTVEAVIGIDGIPRPVCVFQKLDRDLEAESIATVRRWRFAPAVYRGKPVPVLATIGLSFNIARQP